MHSLSVVQPGRKLTVLCLGAHSDDIEIGCGGTLLEWIDAGIDLTVHWCVLSATGARAGEATRSAEAFLAPIVNRTIELAEFKDGFFPYQGQTLKDHFERIKTKTDPDIIFTHRQGDAHQDHREVCKLTWNTFRDHLIFEYEIPKWDGDISQPNFYQPLHARVLDRKIALLDEHFGSQRSKDWFDGDTFRGLARLRGMEIRAPERFAEAFHLRKMTMTRF